MTSKALESTLARELPRLVRRVFIPWSCAVFVAGLATASVFYFRARPFDAKAAVISDLESPDDNPYGYGFAAAGIALCGFLLLPAAAHFHLRLHVLRRKLAFAGTTLLTTGLASAIGIGFLAPFTHDYTPLHVQLAFAAFMGVCSGTVLHLITVAISKPNKGPSARWMLIGKIVLDCVVLLFLVYLYLAPRFFDNARLLTSLALWEWLLCLDCVASIVLLTMALDRAPSALQRASAQCS